ncbi:hypothetical protein NQ317_001955 [Molorchus minor]|uniref:ABC transmembrane type-1 domain-containing protein n=1 Tax=Molorchus minor TaxID=1323400 RepID=A0ABQ9JBR2_9CUCU|nr:hypothetical protein NQ317_001955 [Molorchus minor]
MMGILHLGMKIRVACCSLIYESQTTAGQVVNLLSNDVNRFDVAVLFAHQLWIGPIETIICTYLMYLQVTISALVGVLVLIMFIPMQVYLGKKNINITFKNSLRTDERVRLMNEIVSGIQVIKLYAWEKPFTKLVEYARSTRMSIFASILAYVLLGNNITAEKVFVLTSFYNILRQAMSVFFPQGISQVAEANVSIKRLNQYMLYDETQIAKALNS